MQKEIRLLINTKKVEDDNDIHLFVIQNDQVIRKKELAGNAITKATIRVETSQDVYLCIGHKDYDDKESQKAMQSARLLNAALPSISYFLDALLNFKYSGPLSELYQCCIMHKLRIDLYDEFKLQLDDENIVYRLSCGKEDALEYWYWEADIEKDYKFFRWSYIIYIAKTLILSAIFVALSVLEAKWWILVFPLFLIGVLIKSLTYFPKRMKEEFALIKKYAKDPYVQQHRRDDILYRAVTGKAKAKTHFN